MFTVYEKKGGKSIAKTKAEIQRDYEKRTGYAAQERYNKQNTVSIAIRLMKNTEQDIIQKLDSVPNKAGYIKSLIRSDIAKEKE